MTTRPGPSNGRAVVTARCHRSKRQQMSAPRLFLTTRRISGRDSGRAERPSASAIRWMSSQLAPTMAKPGRCWPGPPSAGQRLGPARSRGRRPAGIRFQMRSSRVWSDRPGCAAVASATTPARHIACQVSLSKRWLMPSGIPRHASADACWNVCPVHNARHDMACIVHGHQSHHRGASCRTGLRACARYQDRIILVVFTARSFNPEPAGNAYGRSGTGGFLTSGAADSEPTTGAGCGCWVPPGA